MPAVKDTRLQRLQGGLSQHHVTAVGAVDDNGKRNLIASMFGGSNIGLLKQLRPSKFNRSRSPRGDFIILKYVRHGVVIYCHYDAAVFSH